MRIYLLVASLVPSAIVAVVGGFFVMGRIEQLVDVPPALSLPAFVIFFAFFFAALFGLCFRALGMQLKKINGRYYVLDHWAKGPPE